MATETRFETLRPLYIAIAIFILIAGVSFAWAAVEAQQAQTKTAAAPSL